MAPPRGQRTFWLKRVLQHQRELSTRRRLAGGETQCGVDRVRWIWRMHRCFGQQHRQRRHALFPHRKPLPRQPWKLGVLLQPRIGHLQRHHSPNQPEHQRGHPPGGRKRCRRGVDRIEPNPTFQLQRPIRRLGCHWGGSRWNRGHPPSWRGHQEDLLRLRQPFPTECVRWHRSLVHQRMGRWCDRARLLWLAAF